MARAGGFCGCHCIQEGDTQRLVILGCPVGTSESQYSILAGLRADTDPTATAYRHPLTGVAHPSPTSFPSLCYEVQVTRSWHASLGDTYSLSHSAPATMRAPGTATWRCHQCQQASEGIEEHYGLYTRVYPNGTTSKYAFLSIIHLPLQTELNPLREARAGSGAR